MIFHSEIYYNNSGWHCNINQMVEKSFSISHLHVKYSTVRRKKRRLRPFNPKLSTFISSFGKSFTNFNNFVLCSFSQLLPFKFILCLYKWRPWQFHREFLFFHLGFYLNTQLSCLGVLFNEFFTGRTLQDCGIKRNAIYCGIMLSARDDFSRVDFFVGTNKGVQK